MLLLAIFAATVLSVRSFVEHADSAKQARPVLSISPEHADLGQIIAGDEDSRRAQFIVENTGSDTLVIESLSELCGCAFAEMSDYSIEPGRKASLVVGLKSVNSTRLLSSAVHIHSNDPVRPTTRVTIRWEVVGPIAFDPPSLSLRPADASTRVRAVGEVEVITYTPEVFSPEDVESVECWPKELEATFIPAVGPGRANAEGLLSRAVQLGTLSVEADETDLVGLGSSWIRLHVKGISDLPAIPVTYVRRQSLRAEPRIVYLGLVHRGTELRRTVKVSSVDGSAFSLLRAIPSSDQIEVAISKIETSAPSHELEIFVLAPERVGAFRETVSVETDLASGASVSFYLAGVINDE
jgi:hypothetical protein